MVGIIIVILVILTFYILTGKNVMAIFAGLISIPFILLAKKYIGGGNDTNDSQNSFSEDTTYDISGGCDDCDDSIVKYEYSGGRKTAASSDAGKKSSKKIVKKASKGDMKGDMKSESSKSSSEGFDPTRPKKGLQGWFKMFVGKAVEDNGLKLSDLDVLEVGARGGVSAFNLAEQVKSWTIVTNEQRASELKKYKSAYPNVHILVGSVNELPSEALNKKYGLIYYDNTFHMTDKLDDKFKSNLKQMSTDSTLMLIAEPSKEMPGRHPKYDVSSLQYDAKALEDKLERIAKAKEFIDKNMTVLDTGRNSNTWVLRLK